MTARLRPVRSLSGLAFGLALALLFLAACAVWMHGDIAFALQAHKITGAIEWQPATDVLTRRLAAFATAVVLVHLLIGTIAWGLARLTVMAFPGLDPRRDLALVAGWMAALALLVLLNNAAWFQHSRFADDDAALIRVLVPVAIALTLIVVGTVVALAILAGRRRLASTHPWERGATAAVAVVATAGLLLIQGASGSAATPSFDRPHIVILGVDSLRDDMTEVADDHRSLTPRIDAFLHGAHRFSDATSPLARTYGSWVAILTGRHPVTTNARFNLMPRALVREGDTIADALRVAGYRTIYATDEVRFANIDESFGFDQLVTPPIGASDFLLGMLGDLPLVNLVAATQAGGLLFPSNHANRGAYVTYRPGDFTERLDREIGISGPTFLAIHLTLAHWPYTWSDQASPDTLPENRLAYRHAIEAVDAQFDTVVQILERKGVLDNAVVIVLSDHGEALGFPSDTIMRKTGTADEIWNSIWGHGTSVLSPHQYGVLLAARAFGRARLPGAAGLHDWPVSLEDVRPTLEEFATGRAPAGVDGVSLLPYLAGTADPETLGSRLRYTETCFNTPKMMAGRIETSGVVTEALAYYELVPETGWVQLRSNRLPELMAKKQRAVLSRGSLLAFVPSWDDDSASYLYSSRTSPLPRRLDGRPDPAQDPEAARLWDALHARFAGELPSPAGLP